MDQVAVFGVLEAEERAVGRQSGAVEPPSRPVRLPERDRFGALVHGFGGTPVLAREDVEAVAVADEGNSDPRALGEAFVPSMRHAFQEGRGRTAVEGLVEPPSRFVARLVLEPDDAGSIVRGCALGDADGMVRDPASLAGREVQRVNLPHDRLARSEGQPIRRSGRPFGQGHRGRSEALFPVWLFQRHGGRA